LISLFKHIVLVSIVCVLFSCNRDEANLPSLKESYAREEKKPFGGYVAFQQLRNIFRDNYLQSCYENFHTTWTSNYQPGSDGNHALYILVTKDLFLSDEDESSMLEYVREGNDLFISADFIDYGLLDALEINVERSQEIANELTGMMRVTKAAMTNTIQQSSESYRYFYYPLLNYFSGLDSTKSRVLGFNESGKPNFVVLFIGRGRVYLHAAPRTLSNYFLLTNNNYQYLSTLAGYFRSGPRFLYWDEFYKHKNYSSRKQQGSRSSNRRGGEDSDENDFSSFNVINEHKELKWAFWLGLLLLLLFAIFNMKRKQRIIPKVEPNTNTTVAFTETIGRLYLQKKNNKNIAEKMITYFFDHIRNNYFLTTNIINHTFMVTLARKSGVPIQQIESLFRTINSIQTSDDVEDFQLLSFNEQVQNFYKTKQ
jgi:hypothetical protein